LVKDIPGVFRGTVEGWLFWVATVTVPLIVLLNPEINTLLNSGTISRWYVFLPLGASLLYATMRANYRRFELQADSFNLALKEVGRLAASLEAIEASKPRVSVRAEGYNIVVVNEGAPGRFRAQMSVTGTKNWTIPKDKIFHVLWSRTMKNESDISTGERDEIRVGAFSPTSGMPAGALLTLHYFNVSHQKPHDISTSYLLEANQQRPRLQMKLSIFPNPGTPVVRDVELNPEGVTLFSE
jgi:hypothetical protein